MHQLKYNVLAVLALHHLSLSFQDTVVALDALSKYSAIIRDEPNVIVHFAASGQERDVSISGADQIKVNTFNLKQAEDIVQLRVSGKGCVLAQVLLHRFREFMQSFRL